MIDISTHGIIIEALTQKCAVEIYLNGIPVGLCGIGTSKKFSRPVHEFLIDGENELAVLVNPGPSPAQAEEPTLEGKPAAGAQPPPDPANDVLSDEPDVEDEDDLDFDVLDNPDIKNLDTLNQFMEQKKAAKEGANIPSPGLPDAPDLGLPDPGLPDAPGLPVEQIGIPPDTDATCMVKLTKYPNGVQAGDGPDEPIIEIDWNAAQALEALAKEKQPFPMWIRKKKDLGPMWGPMHWQEGDKLKPNDKTFADAREFISIVRLSIENGEADPVLDKSKTKYEEVSKVYGIDGNERAAIFKKILNEHAGTPEWLFETTEDDEYSLRMVADHRMIECVNTDWGPSIRGVPVPEKGAFLYPMFIGKVKGDWIIMR